jgi:LacI family transcriptional regulator
MGLTKFNAGSRPRRVALVIETSRTYGRGILRGVARYAHVHGHWSCFTMERELHSGIPGWLRQWKGDGIIARIETAAMARRLLKCGCPVVDVLGQARLRGVPAFDTDHLAVARLAADFFLQSGFRHFAFCGYRGLPFSDRRAVAFADCLSARGLRAREISLAPARKPVRHIQATEQLGIAAERKIARWLLEQARPLAVFACNDICAQQVLNACREHRIRVPEEVAVMGVDNDDVLCSLCDPPLSSIEPDTERLGYESAALLDAMMSGEKPGPPTILIPPARLVERTSTDVIAIEDQITVQALRFIRDRVGEGIAVKDVLRHVNRSRTDIEQRFRSRLNTTVRGEILRRRLDRVCRLLQETGFGLEEIAKKSGFATAAHLCRLFQKHFRQTPTQYRLLCKNRQ